jgi:hypothetical protein
MACACSLGRRADIVIDGIRAAEAAGVSGARGVAAALKPVPAPTRIPLIRRNRFGGAGVEAVGTAIDIGATATDGVEAIGLDGAFCSGELRCTKQTSLCAASEPTGTLALQSVQT